MDYEHCHDEIEGCTGDDNCLCECHDCLDAEEERLDSDEEDDII